MILRFSAILGILVGLVSACTMTGGHGRALVNCPLRETRLYLNVSQGMEPGDLLQRDLDWVDVYCGESVTPVATLRSGIENISSQIEHDSAGNLYVSDSAGEHDPDSPPDAFLIYDRLGRLVRRVLIPGEFRYFVTNKSSGESYIIYFRKEGTLRILAVGGNPPRVQGDYPVAPDAGVPLQPVLDKNGIIFYEGVDDFAIHLMNPRTASVLAPEIPNVRSFIIGRDNKIYARAYVNAHYNEFTMVKPGIIRVYNPRNLRLIRSFRIGSRGFRDTGPSAASVDGTFAVALDKSRVIEIFGPGEDKPKTVIKNIGNVIGITFDNDDTLYVEILLPSRFGPAGVYAFKARTAEVLRSYTFGKHQDVEDMTLIPGGTLTASFPTTR